MKKIVGQKQNNFKRVLVKALLFFVFIIACVCIFRFTPMMDFLTPETLGRLLEASGFWAPVVFVLFFAAGVCLLLPASLLTVLGAAIFGAYWGFLYSWVGALTGASGAFFIGRTLGRDFAASLIGDKLGKYDDAIERNGFASVLYLRLLNTPFTYLNFGMSLTKVRFWDYFFGTGIGVIAGIFILTFLSGTVKEVWTSGNWEELISFKVFLAVALFIFSLFVPLIVKKFKGAMWTGASEHQP